MTAKAVVLVLFLLPLVACVQAPAPSSAESPAPPRNCSPTLAEQLTDKLLAAINRGDASTVIALFPQVAPGAIVIQPELEFSAVPPFPPGNRHDASTPQELQVLVQAANGYQIGFVAKPHGSVAHVDYLIEGRSIRVWTSEISEAQWIANGSGVTFRGGSKISVNCETSLFIRAAL